mmetsp:Transcript_13127/g.21051  ORF Transcript_13127/g.21051 Transcript_13127/m.21051 type:complete len:211 (+) Transcript_13127:550-1182(+)
MPRTIGKELVHCFALKGGKEISVDTDCPGLSYETVNNLQDDNTIVWGDRKLYKFKNLQEHHNYLIGTKFLRPSLHRDIKEGSRIKLTITMSEPQITLYVLLEEGHLQRHGGWANILNTWRGECDVSKLATGSLEMMGLHDTQLSVWSMRLPSPRQKAIRQRKKVSSNAAIGSIGGNSDTTAGSTTYSTSFSRLFSMRSSRLLSLEEMKEK